MSRHRAPPRLGRVLAHALALTLAVLASAGAPARADRLKELVTIEGVRANQLTGFGIVVGLDGTGDDARSPVVRRSLAKMLKRLGVTIDAGEIKAKNVAAVVITAELPPFARPGQALDVTVASMGSAKSLGGGMLIATPLKGADGQTWALAQGALTVGGFAAEGGSGSSSKKNHVTVARLPGGATVEAGAPTTLPSRELVLVLASPDFTTATRIATAIEAALGPGSARARDAGAVVVPLGAGQRGKVPALIAQLEALEVAPDAGAKIIVDERTGTVVVGEHVRLGKAAIAYGGITIQINEASAVSQPGPLSGGKTAVTPATDVKVDEQGGQLTVIEGAASVGDVAAALNALGVKPRDLVSILGALKAAGALRADLEVL
ncbi:MAG: flagellar basal body P-ring protein FlgI [Kofleriaceae bacterium]|nr:flagellar basal body P-ring protein FlgI [Kofleriaceae bacterium]MBP6840233.1 flagellar basal body P-ring protein FlgI [Kofleriaceae bacterium]MBP9204771.1 flagellar basal body P-ring protein FlgI [Kofleriaceae bacterium]